jgi:hypothetical protein
LLLRTLRRVKGLAGIHRNCLDGLLDAERGIFQMNASILPQRVEFDSNIYFVFSLPQPPQGGFVLLLPRLIAAGHATHA